MTAMPSPESLASSPGFGVLGRTPIPGAAPCGTDADGSPDFDAVSSEVGKLTQLDGSPVDWALVVRHATTILAEQSKDLRIAAYLTRGLLEQNGLVGLADGLEVIAGIVSEHWAECWPTLRRMRGRAAALTWVVEKVAPILRTRFVDSHDAESLRRIGTLTNDLSDSLSSLMGDAAPDFSELRSALRDKLRETEQEPANAPPAPAAASGKASAPAAAPAISLAGMLPPDPTSDRAVKQVFTESAAALRPGDLANPLFYHMVRYATWRGIGDLPPTQADGRTQLAPVPSDRVGQYEKLLANGQFVDLIQQVEISVARNPFWLGGHRLVDSALRELEHDAARAAVRHELRTLLGRLPGLPDLRFSDGTPFADAATARWLNDDVLAPPSAQAASAAPAPGGGPGDGWRGILETARATAAEPLELLRHLETGLLAEPEPRRRFLWGMALARACLDQGHPALAEAQLSRLSDQFAALGLSAWEPTLGADLQAALSDPRLHASPLSQSVTGGRPSVLHRGDV